MKLIDEKLVNNYKHKHDFNGSLHDAFDDGVEFTERLLKQKIIELLNYVSSKYESDFCDEFKYGFSKYDSENNLVFLRPEQLLEEFITQQE